MNTIKLVGQPNSGKSSLFNLLTGLNQKIGNYSGVTVEKKTGKFNDFKIVDLPGLRSLWPDTQDERISQQSIIESAKEKAPIIFVINGNQFASQLILFSQIADLQLPMTLVINFKDELIKNNIKIQVDTLKSKLGCPVILLNSKTGDGINELKGIIERDEFKVPNAFNRSQFDSFEQSTVSNSYIDNILLFQDNIDSQTLEIQKQDYLKRKNLIDKIVDTSSTIKKEESSISWQEKWDKVILNPFSGSLIFIAVMLIVFQSVFTFASLPMDWIDASFATLSEWASNNLNPEWLAGLISDGILAGIGGVVIFIPQIAILFFLLGILEHSGYLSRISHLSDRFLRQFGLSGKSVIPLMSSWACAIPAIMSTRMIEDPKERKALIFASPLMTCSARLPVYSILIAILVPEGKDGFFDSRGLLLLLFYLIGVLATLIIAYLASRKIRKGASLPWILELPKYRMPNWRSIFYNTYLKSKSFVVDAGKIIFIISIVLWALASFSPKSDSFINNQYTELQKTNPDVSQSSVELEYSYIGYLGKVIEPIIKPLGYDWKIGIALIASFAAREVFVGSLSTIYSVGSEEELPVLEKMRAEIIPSTGELRFNKRTSISLLLFYAFALQCMSTIAIVKKEANSWKFAGVQFVAFLSLAYIAAFIGFRIF